MHQDSDIKVNTLRATCPTCGMAVDSMQPVCPADGAHLNLLNTDPALRRKYHTLEIIGEGGMGVLYKARHLESQKLVAIKLMRANLAHDEAVKRFQMEGKACNRLNHPVVVHVHDLGTTQTGFPYLVMDYIQGITLATLLAEKYFLPEARVVDLFTQITEGIAHAHSHDVLHRDLKPTNIMIVSVNGHMEPRILDFGIAKIMKATGEQGGTVTTSREILGSPCYMSPEQANGEKLDGRSDLYSLGCVMFEALAGMPPYHGGEPMHILFEQANAPIPKLSDANPDNHVSASLAKIVESLLQKDPSDRIPSADALLADLVALKNGQSSNVTPRGVGLWPSMGWIAIAALALCLIFAGWFMLTLK
jgi:serine/threonine-protein kinase